jgi:hypothetical protein
VQRSLPQKLVDFGLGKPLILFGNPYGYSSRSYQA